MCTAIESVPFQYSICNHSQEGLMGGMSKAITGGCLCGEVSYRAVVGDSKTVAHCYCSMCRRLSGGTFVTYAEFPAKDFAYTKGQPQHFKSSDFAVRGFCGSCGCQFTFQYFGERKEITESIWITVGSMDRPDEIEPTDHIFTAEKLPWLYLDQQLAHWPGQLPWLRPGVDSPETNSK